MTTEPSQQTDRLLIVPVTQAQAFDFIAAYHRHHIPPVGTKFCIGVADEGGGLAWSRHSGTARGKTQR